MCELFKTLQKPLCSQDKGLVGQEALAVLVIEGLQSGRRSCAYSSEAADVCSVLHSGTKSKTGTKSVLRPPATPPELQSLWILGSSLLTGNTDSVTCGGRCRGVRRNPTSS